MGLTLASQTTSSLGNRVRVPKTAEIVAARLRGQIVRNELPSGSGLPPESALMEQFGVSRPTLREAFRILESENLITIHRGSRGGARIQAPDVRVAGRYAALVLEHSGATLADVYECRKIIEVQAVRILAAKRTKADIKALRAHHELVTETDQLDERYVEAVHGFHQLVVDLAGNRTLAVVDAIVLSVISLVGVNDVVKVNKTYRPEDRARYESEHEKLIDLIEARDVDGAEEEWRAHCDATRMPLGRLGINSVLDVFT